MQFIFKLKDNKKKIKPQPFISQSQPQNQVRQRTLIPQYNNLNSNKTIVHSLGYTGIGDFLRGSILLAQIAKNYNINFKIDVSKHNIFNYLDTEFNSDVELKNTHEPSKVNIPTIFNTINNKFNTVENNNIISHIKNFISSNNEIDYINTNYHYNFEHLTEDIKSYINSIFKFKQKYYDTAKELFNLDKYAVLHIRCRDKDFNTDFNDNNLLLHIMKLKLPINTIVVSNNHLLKIKLKDVFGFYFIDKPAVHTANKNEDNLESTILEYIILSRSSYTYCFSYYEHGSGFSEQCSVLNSVPYSVVCLPCDVVVPLPFVINDNLNINNKFTYDDIAFITLTNDGYTNYTLNCLKSLKKANIKPQLKAYCIGNECYSILKNETICEFIDNTNLNELITFYQEKWSAITLYKFEIIYKNLLNNQFVCFTDGDIDYENNKVFDYLLNNINDNDMLIQSEGIHINELCTGFMFINSNEKTLELFNPENVKRFFDFNKKPNCNDQTYINSIQHKVKYNKLPISLFPSGYFYYKYDISLQPYLIHFNWLIGNEKKDKMVKYNKWYL